MKIHVPFAKLMEMLWKYLIDIPIKMNSLKLLSHSDFFYNLQVCKWYIIVNNNIPFIGHVAFGYLHHKSHKADHLTNEETFKTQCIYSMYYTKKQIKIVKQL